MQKQSTPDFLADLIHNFGKKDSEKWVDSAISTTAKTEVV